LADLLIAARAVHFASTSLVAGALIFAVLVSEPAFRSGAEEPPVAPPLRRHLVWITGVSVAVAFASGAAWLVLLSAEIGGGSLSGGVVWTVLTLTQFGRAWQVRLALAALLALALLLDRRLRLNTATASGIRAALAAALAGSLAWAGHAGATEGVGGDIHLVADVLHLVAAAAWLGALLPLALLFAATARSGNVHDADVTLNATARFSTLGIVSVGTLLVTGSVNTWFLAGTIPALLGTAYGRLLLIKIALFAAMVGVASINRSRLTPRLAHGLGTDRGRIVLGRLARNTTIEIVLGLLVLAIVGVLGTTVPALHVQPLWPFPLRLDGNALEGPDAVAAVALITITAAAGTLAIVAGPGLRRWLLVCAGVVAVVFALRFLSNLTVPAYPTTFMASPTGFSAASVAHGHALYVQNCASCHGLDGRGDRPAAKQLDLTADHIYGHTDGDLFWWVSHGIAGAMPGFSEAIDDEGRWALVDFVHANADAVRLRAAANNPGFPTPDFTAECPDGSTVSLSDKRGSVVHIIIAGPQSSPRLHELAHAHLMADLTTIVIANDEAAKDLSFCSTREQATREAFAVYLPKDTSGGAEFLVDPAGQLRAIWYPGLQPAWTDPEVLRRRIADIDHVVPARTAAQHAHGH
jgi:putative copper resistance protein D